MRVLCRPPVPLDRQAGRSPGDTLRAAQDRGIVLPTDGTGRKGRVAVQVHPSLFSRGRGQAEEASAS